MESITLRSLRSRHIHGRRSILPSPASFPAAQKASVSRCCQCPSEFSMCMNVKIPCVARVGIRQALGLPRCASHRKWRWRFSKASTFSWSGGTPQCEEAPVTNDNVPTIASDSSERRSNRSARGERVALRCYSSHQRCSTGKGHSRSLIVNVTKHPDADLTPFRSI